MLQGGTSLLLKLFVAAGHREVVGGGCNIQIPDSYIEYEVPADKSALELRSSSSRRSLGFLLLAVKSNNSHTECIQLFSSSLPARSSSRRHGQLGESGNLASVYVSACVSAQIPVMQSCFEVM